MYMYIYIYIYIYIRYTEGGRICVTYFAEEGVFF